MSDVAPNVAGEAPVKTAKQLEKEAKKAAKLAKFQEKQIKTDVPKEVMISSFDCFDLYVFLL